MESNFNNTSSLGNAFIYALNAAGVAFRLFNEHNKPDGKESKDAKEHRLLETASRQLQQTHCKSLADIGSAAPEGVDPCTPGASSFRRHVKLPVPSEEDYEMRDVRLDIKQDNHDKQDISMFNDECENMDTTDAAIFNSNGEIGALAVPLFRCRRSARVKSCVSRCGMGTRAGAAARRTYAHQCRLCPINARAVRMRRKSCFPALN